MTATGRECDTVADDSQSIHGQTQDETMPCAIWCHKQWTRLVLVMPFQWQQIRFGDTLLLPSLRLLKFDLEKWQRLKIIHIITLTTGTILHCKRWYSHVVNGLRNPLTAGSLTQAQRSVLTAKVHCATQSRKQIHYWFCLQIVKHDRWQLYIKRGMPKLVSEYLSRN